MLDCLSCQQARQESSLDSPSRHFECGTWLADLLDQALAALGHSFILCFTNLALPETLLEHFLSAIPKKAPGTLPWPTAPTSERRPLGIERDGPPRRLAHPGTPAGRAAWRAVAFPRVCAVANYSLIITRITD